MTTFFILGQIFTLVSYLVFWFSRFLKSKNNILFWDNVSRVVTILAFVFLGTYDGIKNTLYAILRNVLGQVTNKKKQKYKIITNDYSLGMILLQFIALVSWSIYIFTSIQNVIVYIGTTIDLLLLTFVDFLILKYYKK